MKTSELFEIRYNEPRPKVDQVKVYVDQDHPNAQRETQFKEKPGGGWAMIPTGRFYVYQKQKIKDAEGKQVYYKPYSNAGYRPASKDHPEAIFGTVGEWLQKMGATREHLAPAIKKVRASNEYHHLMSLGFEENTTAGDLKNGTLSFRGTYEPIIGSTETPRPVVRKVLANGNIRTMARENSAHGGRGSAAHPMTAATHPHMDPVDRIAQSMQASIERIAKIYQVQSKRHFVQSIKRHKETT